MLAQSQQNLESQAKQQLEEVYSEECQTDFDSDSYPLASVEEISPLRPNANLLSGWDSSSKAKRDKSTNESPNKQARSILSSLGENIERYQTNPKSRITCGQHIKQNSITQRIRMNNMPPQTKGNSLSFIEVQPSIGQILNSLQQSRQGTQRHSQLIGSSLNTQAIQRKFNLDFQMFRTRLKSVDSLNQENTLKGNHHSEMLPAQNQQKDSIQQDYSLNLHLETAPQFQEDDTNSNNEEGEKQFQSWKMRASSAKGYPKHQQTRQLDRSREILVQTQPQLLQIKILSTPNIETNENDRISLNKSMQKQNGESMSPTFKVSHSRRINLYRRSFQSAINQIQSGGGASSSRDQARKGSQDQSAVMNGSYEHSRYSQASTRKQRNSTDGNIPLETTPVGRQVPAIYRHSFSTQIIDHSYIINDSTNANISFQPQNIAVTAAASTTGLMTGKTSVNSSHSNFLKLLNSQAGNQQIISNEDLIRLSVKKQTVIASNLNTKQEGARNPIKLNCVPITLRSYMLHRRFDSIKNSVAQNQKISAATDRLCPTPSCQSSTKVQQPTANQENVKVSSPSADLRPIQNQHSKSIHLKNRQAKMQQPEKIISKRESVPNITVKVNARNSSTSSQNRLPSSSRYQQLARSVGVADFKDNHIANVGCIQNNFLYKRILNSQ